MKRASCFVVCVFLSFLWVPIASAGQNTGPATQTQQAQGQKPAPNGQIIQPKAGISWKEKVQKQRDVKDRAAARRNVLMQQAEKGKAKSQQSTPPPAVNP